MINIKMEAPLYPLSQTLKPSTFFSNIPPPSAVTILSCSRCPGEKSSTPSNRDENPEADNLASVSASSASTSPGDHASEDADRSRVEERIPPPPEAFLAMAAFEAKFRVQFQKLQEACETLTRATNNWK